MLYSSSDLFVVSFKKAFCVGITYCDLQEIFQFSAFCRETYVIRSAPHARVWRFLVWLCIDACGSCRERKQKMMKTDILIVGSGCAALYFALQIPKDKKVLLITKADFESSDSFLAQGGICMLRDESDYQSYYEDTMRAGHNENDPVSVDIMIRSSQDVIRDLIACGVRFAKDENGALAFTREGAHSSKRILFHEDITGKEITSHLLEAVKRLPNVTLMEYTSMLDIVTGSAPEKTGAQQDRHPVFRENILRSPSGEEKICRGAVLRFRDGSLGTVQADYTVLATGGIGGLFRHSTNFRQLTGDAVAVALKHGVETEHVNYIQVHPTTFYSGQEEDRSFLISESVRGEGAKLYGKDRKRFTNELLPRDLLTIEILKQMKKDGTKFVWEDLRTIPHEELIRHFPNIIRHCAENGYDVTKECIPVVPAQHYFMGGVKVNHESRTSMPRLYAIGECACNGVHGRNRLASNSLLEALVFAKRAAVDMLENYQAEELPMPLPDLSGYRDADALEKDYAAMIRNRIEAEGGPSSTRIAYRSKFTEEGAAQAV